MSVHRHHRRSLVAIAAAMSAAFAAAPAFAQEAAPAPAAVAADRAAVFANVTLAPLDRLDATLARGGMPGVGDRLAGLMSAVRLFTAQQVDRTRGASIAFIAGEQINRNTGTIICVPVVAGAAPLANLRQGGAQAVAGHDDAVALAGLTFRRSDAYLMFGGHQPSVVGLAPAEIDASVRDEGRLLSARLDVAAARAAAPKAFERFLADSAAREPLPTDPAAAAGNQMGREAAMNFIRGLDRIDVALASGGAPAAGAAASEAATLDVAVAPVAFKTPAVPANLTRPAFPAGSVARLDWAYPAAEAVPAFKSGALRMMTAQKPAESPAHEAEATAMFDAIADLVIGDAVSIAYVPAAAGKPAVAYAVVRRTAPGKSLAQKLDALEAAAAPIAARKQRPAPFKRSTYDEGGTSVHRVEVLGDDDAKVVQTIDLVELDGRLLAAISADGGRHLVGPFATLRAEPGAPLTHLAEAELDLPKLKELLGELPPGTVPPAAAAALAGLNAADRLTVVADGDGTTFKVRSTLPLNALGAMLKRVIP